MPDDTCGAETRDGELVCTREAGHERDVHSDGTHEWAVTDW